MAEDSPQNLRPLSDSDIERLGRMTAFKVLGLPENLVGSDPEGEQAIDEIVEDLNYEAIVATNTQVADPEEIDDDQI